MCTRCRFLRFYIVLRPQGIRKQMKTIWKRHGVHIALGPVHTETFSCGFVLFQVMSWFFSIPLRTVNNTTFTQPTLIGFGLDLNSEPPPVKRKWIEFGLSSNPHNRGGMRKNSDSIRLNENTIRLNVDWRWACCYGEKTIRCLLCNVCPKCWTSTLIFTQSPELEQFNVNATGKYGTSPVSVQIQTKSASVNRTNL